jgi:hypothetical protein
MHCRDYDQTRCGTIASGAAIVHFGKRSTKAATANAAPFHLVEYQHPTGRGWRRAILIVSRSELSLRDDCCPLRLDELFNLPCVGVPILSIRPRTFQYRLRNRRRCF